MKMWEKNASKPIYDTRPLDELEQEDNARVANAAARARKEANRRAVHFHELRRLLECQVRRNLFCAPRVGSMDSPTLIHLFPSPVLASQIVLDGMVLHYSLHFASLRPGNSPYRIARCSFSLAIFPPIPLLTLIHLVFFRRRSDPLRLVRPKLRACALRSPGEKFLTR